MRGVIPIGCKVFPLKKSQHPAARCTYSDGSAVNTCEKCRNWDARGPGSIPHVMVGYCMKHKATNMLFGNCDDWWPKSETAEGVQLSASEGAASLAPASHKKATAQRPSKATA